MAYRPRSHPSCSSTELTRSRHRRHHPELGDENRRPRPLHLAPHGPTSMTNTPATTRLPTSFTQNRGGGSRLRSSLCRAKGPAHRSPGKRRRSSGSNAGPSQSSTRLVRRVRDPEGVGRRFIARSEPATWARTRRSRDWRRVGCTGSTSDRQVARAAPVHVRRYFRALTLVRLPPERRANRS